MDPRVLAHFDGDLTRANLSPRKRDRILATYPPPGAPAAVAGRCGRPERARPPRRDEVLAARCPGCGYVYEVERRRRARGLRGRHRLGRHPRRLVLPRLRRPREGRLRAGAAADRRTS